MYGWRARIGVLLPTNNTVLEPEFGKLRPEGVTCHITRMISSTSGHGSIKGLNNMVNHSVDKAIEELSITGVDVFAYACLSTSLVVADWQQRLQDKIACFSKVPPVSAFTAMISALYFIKAKKVSVLCPYGDELVNKVSDAFNAYDISAARIESLNVTGLRDVCNVSLPEIYRTARKIDMSDSDALCILATDLATLPLTTVLEQDLEKPVVSTNLALMWASLLLAGITPHISGAGQLMEMMKDVDAAKESLHKLGCSVHC